MNISRLKDYLALHVAKAMAASDDDLNRMLAAAVQLHLGNISQQSMYDSLETYYRNVDTRHLKKAIDYDRMRAKVVASGYKVDLLDYHDNDSTIWNSIGVWERKLVLMRRLNIRMDLLYLRQGDSIPPHAHRGVLSGFMLLEGKVAIRHYHVENYLDDSLDIRKTLDMTLDEGGYTVNSEQQDNIHWLKGLAEESILFRFNQTDLPSDLPDYDHLAGRLYVDPAHVGTDSVTNVHFIDEKTAKQTIFL